MNNNDVIEEVRIRTAAQKERARERMRGYFERHNRSFAMSRRSRRGELWVLVITVACTGVMIRSHSTLMQVLSVVHSLLGV